MSDATAAGDVPVSGMDPEIRDQLHDLILALADSKRILGIRYADWALGAPELEACIAASSLAQDEWGHARILYALLKDFDEDPNRIEHEREATEYRNIESLDRPFETWPEFVVGNAIVDTAITVQIEALTRSRYASLRQRVRKQLDEEQFHFGHGAAWFRRLGRSAEEARAQLVAALERAWPITLRWFGPDDHGQRLKAEEFTTATGGELRQELIDRLAPLLTRSGIDRPETRLEFAGWDPATRRADDGGPDPDALARARGDRNRAFLMD
jgi:phenylacetate-CoA oxygenase PaaI subunit